MYLGIDGGGTKTKVIIINDTNEIIFENVDGPSSVDTVSIDITYKSILNALSPYLKDNISFDSIFAGLGGIVFKEQKDEVIKILKTLPGVTNKTKILVENDMYNALYSGLLFDEGITLICGTGMVAFGKDTFGNTAKCGGWGFKEGEIGSGYYLGKEAVSYMIRAFDGRLKKDDFALEVAKEIGLEKTTDIILIMNDLHLNRTKVASLAPIVTKYANLDHEYALKIVDKATDELLLAITGVINQLNLTKQEIVIVGGLANANGKFKDLLHKKINEKHPKLNILKSKVDPALAAAMMASKL